MGTSRCPRCGGQDIRVVPSRQVVSVRGDYQCAACKTVWSPPFPRWAAGLFMISAAGGMVGLVGCSVWLLWTLVHDAVSGQQGTWEVFHSGVGLGALIMVCWFGISGCWTVVRWGVRVLWRGGGEQAEAQPAKGRPGRRGEEE